MLTFFGKQNLRTKFFVSSSLLMVGFGLIFSFLYYRHVKQIVMDEALSKSELILQEVEAIRDYVKEELRPKMYDLHDRDIFIIEAMSTTYVSLNIMKRFGKKMEGYVFRRASLNPLNPANRADLWEEEMFDWFEADQKRTFWQGLVKRSDGSYFVSMIPDYMGASCLRCHGDPKAAPGPLIAKYGRKGGFCFQEGDLAGIDSVAIPISNPLSQLRKLTLTLFLSTVAGTFLLLSLLNLLFGKLVISRLATVMALLDQEEKGFREQTDVTPTNHVDELDSLNESFGYLHRYVKTARKGSQSQPNFIGAFVIGKPLAAGSMSWLYEGRQSSDGKNVTLKIPFENITVNPLYRACWQSEIRIFNHVDHENKLEVIKHEGDILVLESLPDGPELELQPEKLGLEKFQPIFLQLCDLLATLHTMGIVHHDIQPRNFFLAQDKTIKLIDMGLASWRDIPDAIFESGIGPQGDFRYMAPEQISGRRGDPRSDIYSLGVLLYLVATGTLPFEKSRSSIKTWLHIKGTFKLPQDSSRELPDGLEEIIRKAMAGDRKERYQWVEDFRDDFIKGTFI